MNLRLETIYYIHFQFPLFEKDMNRVGRVQRRATKPRRTVSVLSDDKTMTLCRSWRRVIELEAAATGLKLCRLQQSVNSKAPLLACPIWSLDRRGPADAETEETIKGSLTASYGAKKDHLSSSRHVEELNTVLSTASELNTDWFEKLEKGDVSVGISLFLQM
ncbi:hypothetical protein WISP_147844 [Willisornis vidua]|uniref:Uncharacterized protein n=1 Tax=Willisornis vidua TaxID=1566151 RepID=A0ABQ9CKC6_9PASS|nr:hypothetical protein WISP_147844 [Willisornis vidua]